MSIVSLNAIRFTVPQRKLLKKDSTLVIDNPPANARWYVEDLVKKTDGTPTAVLAMLLHASQKHLSTVTEFQYEVNPGRAKRKSKKSLAVETHIFIFQVPDRPQPTERDPQRLEEKVSISKEPISKELVDEASAEEEVDEADEVKVEDDEGDEETTAEDESTKG